MATENYTLDVLVEGYDEEKALAIDSTIHWQKIFESRQNQTILQALVTGMENKVFQVNPVKEKLCALVEVGDIRGMIPIDFLGIEADDPKQIDKARRLIGEKVVFVVIAVDRNNDFFVGSRSEAIRLMADHCLRRIHENDSILAVVRQVFNSNMIVDIGGIQCSIPASEVSHGWVDSMQDLYKPGDHIRVKVLAIDKENKTVKVSIKALQPNPWSRINDYYKEQGEYVGTISGTAEFGVYVTLRDGISGLARLLRHEIVKKGDKVLVRVMKIDKNQQHMNLKITKIIS